MPVQLVTMGSWFNRMLGDISYDPNSEAGKLYPFVCRIGCVKRRPARHEFFELFLNIGQQLIEPIMHHEKLNSSQLAFVFPERWMGQAERQAFTHCLKHHPEAKLVNQLDMITSDPLLIGSFMSAQVRILTWPEDEGLYDGSYGND